MGCDSSISDANQLKQCCLNNGILLTQDCSLANYVVLFSCGFNKVILSENLIKLKKLRKISKAKLILAGCIPKIKNSSKKLVDYSFGPKELYKFNNLFNLKRRIEDFSPKFNREDRQIIRISTGCCGRCSYCAIKIATGFVKSRKEEEIVKDIRNGLSQGIKKFVLTSEDNGSWGQDNSTNICFLLKKINEIPGNFRVLLTTFNPKWFLEYPELYELFKLPKFEKNVYLSLQSGSNRILKLMNRGYTVEDYLEVYDRLKKEIPLLKIRSDFLIGFPSEKEDDFNETYNLLKKLDFYFVQIFAYTDMEKTEAMMMKPKIRREIKYRRTKELINLFLEKNKDEKRALIQTNLY